MAFSITKTWVSGEVLTHTDLNASFDEVENVLNGGLTSANLSSSAGITNAQLANSHYEMWIELGFRGVRATVVAADSATTPQIIMPLPGTTTDGTSYTVISGAWWCSDCGAQTDDFDVVYGYYNTANPPVWQNLVTIATVTNAPSRSTVNDQVGHGALTIASAGPLVFSAYAPGMLGVRFTQTEATFCSNATDSFRVCLKLRRTDGLRSA